ncbi:MAG: CubicO group peptidase (beta-lactamase class C family) [Candidatus Paceibacteria bacterium]|jgi:CubicO group peptidase (beta-lactamase class C family)
MTEIGAPSGMTGGNGGPLRGIFDPRAESSQIEAVIPRKRHRSSKSRTPSHQMTLSRIPCLTFALGVLFSISNGVLAGGSQDFAGTWRSEFKAPFDPRPLEIRFGLEQNADGTWQGGFEGDMFGTGLLRGQQASDGLELECDLGESNSPFQVKSDGSGGLACLLNFRGMPISLECQRTSDTWAEDLHLKVSLPQERPEHISLDGLPDTWRDPIASVINRAMDAGNIAGLALAVVIDGELLDARSWGWRDVMGRLPVSDSTLFRWGSISKSVTGVVSVKMANADRLDLDQDVRKLVPEFPLKEHVVTPRLLLGHLGGIVHYQHMPSVTRIDYGTEFPFRDPVRAIDMFREAALIHEPGTKYSYSTHGFALVGAVIERASKKGYLGEVTRLVSGPLGMTSFEPDDPAAPREERTTGYRLTQDGRLFDAGDSDVSWKLAGGGFQSTAADLGRFAAGICDGYFLSDQDRELLFTKQTMKGANKTPYGLGFNIMDIDGQLAVVHGGAQRRTRTFLVCAPDAGIAVVLMCNTEGSNLSDPGREILGVLLNE